MARQLNRRLVLGGIAGLAVAPALAKEVVFDIENMLPGEFSWQPKRAPEGAVAIVVSLPQQLVHVYRNGVRIGVSTASSGKPGHETPTGVFTILQKDKHHHSSTYNNASMPNTERLTWDGVALHAGGLPGYPSSHGCVHLPMAFSELVFGITHIGTPVIVAGSQTDAWELVHPGLILGNFAEDEMAQAVAGLTGKSHPSDWTTDAAYPVTTVIATGADRRIVLIENDVVVLESELTIDGSPELGEHVMTLGAEGPGGGYVWHGVTHHPDPSQPLRPEAAVMQRLRAPKAFRDAMAARMHPGMVMIVSDLAAGPERRSGRDFTIMTGETLETPRPGHKPPHETPVEATPEG